MKLLVATGNPGKVEEFRLLLAPLELELRFPFELELQVSVVEDGATYLDNARKKARAYMQASGLPALADDSGLEVDALDGAPGVHSARYASGHDADRVTALLAHLRDVPREERTARFRCVVAISPLDGRLHVAEGTCEGMIAFEPVGRGGFGYDPIFYLPEYGCTMAQLPRAEKNRISHRARAIEEAMPLLRHLSSEHARRPDRA